jgi:hypothetical protein
MLLFFSFFFSLQLTNIEFGIFDFVSHTVTQYLLPR